MKKESFYLSVLNVPMKNGARYSENILYFCGVIEVTLSKTYYKRRSVMLIL
jgi:hypothetical protein